MNLLNYILVGGGSLILGLALIIVTKNFLTGLLIVALLFGGYVLLNVVKDINRNPSKETPPPSTPQQ